MKNPMWELVLACSRIKLKNCRKANLKSKGMQKNPELTVTPVQVPQNATLTVRSGTANFPQPHYTITDENGRVIRKGSVNERISEFKLSMVGLTTGVYRFTMGQVQEKFVVIS
jgi:hypothetical protein